MNTLICLGLLLCVSVAVASALPVSEPELAKEVEQAAPELVPADESLEGQESRHHGWGGGGGYGGGWGGRHGGWGGRHGGWGGRGGYGGSWGYGGGYGGGWGGGYGGWGR